MTPPTQPQILLARLRLWFEQNPEDTLAAPDVVVKFGVHHATARTTLRALHKLGVIDYAEGHRRNPAEYALRPEHAAVPQRR